MEESTRQSTQTKGLPMDMPTILFVDDEQNILKALQRLFSDEPYRLLVANSGQDALALLAQGEQPTIIVSDQRMPGMGGVEFLREAKKIAPKSIRMVLTGYADLNAAVDAVNLGGVSRYLMKPWNDDDLKLTIREAVIRADLECKNRELTEQLAKQNRILEELNEDLEHKVEERTKELKASYEENLALTLALQKKVRELEGRDRLQRHLLTLHPLDATLREVLAAMAYSMEADSAGIFLAPFVTEGMVPEASHQTADSTALSIETAKIDPALICQVAATGSPVCMDYPAGRERAPQHCLALALAPIGLGDERFAVVALARACSRPFADEDLKAVIGFSELAAIAIRDSRLNGELSSFGSELEEIFGKQ